MQVVWFAPYMEGYEASTYGDRIADVYDTWFSHAALDTEGAVEFLAGLAGTGPALELAIGTGRIALPLAARGLEVHGIDVSEAMVAKLREKPGGEVIPVTMGNFADVGVEGHFPLVFIVFNTFFALLTQEEQVRCFENVVARLADDGAFVIEAFVPDLSRFDATGQRTEATRVDADGVVLTFSRVDTSTQQVESLAAVVSEQGFKTYPVGIRFAWPSELDLMARLAGLRLRDRWADWDQTPFDARSTKHVSVYERVR